MKPILSHIFLQEGALIGSFFLGATFLFGVTGLAWFSYGVGFVAYLLIHVWALRYLVSWLSAEKKPILPKGVGLWQEVFFSLNRDYQASLKSISAMEQQVNRYRLASMLLPDGLISLSEQGRIEWLNQSAERLLGIRQEDLGKKIEYFLRDPVFLNYLGRQEYDHSIELYSPLKKHQLLSVQILPYFKEYQLLLVRDITEVNKMVQMRRDFVANASHELRTPLTVLSGYLEMLEDLSQQDSEFALWQQPIVQMVAQSERMKRIIDDLLVLSSIESKTSLEGQERVDVVKLLQRVEQQGQQISAGHHAIELICLTDHKLIGLAESLESLFMNLVSNAIRYTPSGGKIEIRWFEEAERWVFQVKDNGIGIAREDIPRLTERFFRVDSARSRETGGTGLGLAIVKHIVDLHQAELEITSERYVGSEFSVYFSKKSN